MKQLKCEMCGSNDLVKQDGVFVCQSCGCKYSIEEAKKLMIEGPVEVKGSVTLDNSQRLQNLYQLARRAKDDNQGESAIKYYEMISIDDPTSWEASFYIVYFKALDCKIAEITSAAFSIKNCERTVFQLIKDHVPSSQQKAAVDEVCAHIILAAHILSKSAYEHYSGISENIKSQYTDEVKNRLCASEETLFFCGDQIISIFGSGSEISKIAIEVWKSGVTLSEKYGALSHYPRVDYYKQKIDNTVLKNTSPVYTVQDKVSVLRGQISTLEQERKNKESSIKALTGVTIAVFIGGLIFLAKYFLLAPIPVAIFVIIIAIMLWFCRYLEVKKATKEIQNINYKIQQKQQEIESLEKKK